MALCTVKARTGLQKSLQASLILLVPQANRGPFLNPRGDSVWPLLLSKRLSRVSDRGNRRASSPMDNPGSFALEPKSDWGPSSGDCGQLFRRGFVPDQLDHRVMADDPKLHAIGKDNPNGEATGP